MAVVPARAKSYAAGQLFSGPGFYRGYTLRETTGAASATIRLWDNTSAAGVLLATIVLAQGTSAQFHTDMGIQTANGVFAETVSGAVEGSVFLG